MFYRTPGVLLPLALVGLGLGPAACVTMLEALPCHAWSYVGHLPSDGEAVVVSKDGRMVYSVGFVQEDPPAGAMSALLVANEAVSGRALWETRLEASAEMEAAYAGGLSQDGNVLFLTGTQTRPDGAHQFQTVALAAASGAILWSSPHEGAHPDGAQATQMAVDGLRGLLFVGGGDEVIAYDGLTGAEVWWFRYPKTITWPSVEDLVVTSDGVLHVLLDDFTGSPAVRSLAVVQHDAQTGRVLGESFFGSAGHPSSHAFDLAIGGGREFVGATTIRDGAPRLTVVAFSASSGEFLWSHSFGNAVDGFNVPVSIDVSPDGGRVFVAGTVRRSPLDGIVGQQTDFAVAAFDAADGRKLWDANVPALLEPAGGRWAQAIAAGNNGHIYVTGYVGDVTVGYQTFSIDARGRTEWSAVFSASPVPVWYPAYARGMALDNVGHRLYVTGLASDPLQDGEYGIATVAYDIPP